jgi:ferrochelatase
MAKQAVLLLAHGTPETVEQIPEYLRNVVSGRPLPQHVIEEIQHRYSLIGRSPLTEITMEQARLVEAELAAKGTSGQSLRGHAQLAALYSRCGAADARRWSGRGRCDLHGAAEFAHQRGPLSPRCGGRGGGLRIDFTAGWAQHPLLIEAFAERLRPALSKLSARGGRAGSGSVHGPQRSLPDDSDLRRPAKGSRACGPARRRPLRGGGQADRALVAARVPEIPQWWFAFQSQGASGGPWIGPTVEQTLESIAAEGVRPVLLQPIGFLCDHVEILL